jgi:hypothetical protein
MSKREYRLPLEELECWVSLDVLRGEEEVQPSTGWLQAAALFAATERLEVLAVELEKLQLAITYAHPTQ